MAGIDDTGEAMTAHDLKEALSRSKTLHISCSRPYNFRQKEGRSEVSGIKPESDDIIHDMQSLGELCIQSWSRTGDRTSLLLSSHSLPIIEVISILSTFCKQLKHLIFDAYRLDVSMYDIRANSPSRMESVLIVSLSCMVGSLVIGDALAFTAWCFPNASILKVIGRINLKSSSGSKVKPTLDLEELVLTLEDNLTLSLGSLLNTVSAACRKLKRFHIYSDRKFPLHTLPKIISQLACPELEFLELCPAQISLGKRVALESVSWQKSSERCELKLDKASAELPVMAVVSVVSRKLKEVTVLSLNDCEVKLPEKIGVPQRKLREKTLIREINFLNMKNPVPAARLQDRFTINVTLRGSSHHDGADMVHKYRSANEKPVEMPPPAKKRAHPSPEPNYRQLRLDFERKLDRKQTSTSTPAHRKRERPSQEKQANGIPASFTDGKAPVQPNGQEEIHFSQLDPEERLDKEQTSTSTPAHIHARKRERPSQEKQTNGIPASFTEGKAPSKRKCVRKPQLDPEGSLDEEQTSTSTQANMHARKNERNSQERPTHTITVGKEQNHSGKLQRDPEGKLDREQTSSSTPAPIHARKRERPSQEKQTNGIPASNTERKAPAEPKHFRKLQLDPEGKLDEEQTSTSTPAHIRAKEREKTSQGTQEHRILASYAEGEELKHLGKRQRDPEGKLDKEQTSTSTPAPIHARKRERPSQEKQTNGIPASNTEAPSRQEYGRKLQLDPEGSLDEEQTSTSTPANMHARKNERTSQGRPTHTITEGEAPSKQECGRKLQLDRKGSHDKEQTSKQTDRITEGKAPVEPNRQGEIHFNQPDPEGSRDEEQTSTSTTAHMYTTEMEKSTQERPTHRIPTSITEGKEQGASKVSSSSVGNTDWRSRTVTDREIKKLTKLLTPDVCSDLCVELDLGYAFYHQIKAKHHPDYRAAFVEILWTWKQKTGGLIESLDKALDRCDVGALKHEYKERMY